MRGLAELEVDQRKKVVVWSHVQVTYLSVRDPAELATASWLQVVVFSTGE
jgi:hypothetical protein